MYQKDRDNGEDQGGVGEVEWEKRISHSFWDPQKTQALIFLTTSQKKKQKSLFYTVDKNKPV